MLLTCPQGPAGRSGAKGRGSGDGPGPWGLASGSWDLSPAWSVSAMNGPHTGHTSGTVLQGQLLSGRWCPCLAARLGPQGPGPGGESCPRSFISVTGPPPQRSAEGTVKPPPPRSALEGGQGLRPVPAAAPQPQDPTQGRPRRCLWNEGADAAGTPCGWVPSLQAFVSGRRWCRGALFSPGLWVRGTPAPPCQPHRPPLLRAALRKGT